MEVEEKANKKITTKKKKNEGACEINNNIKYINMSQGETKNSAIELLNRHSPDMMQVSIDNLVRGKNYLVQVNLGNLTREGFRNWLIQQYTDVNDANQQAGFEMPDIDVETDADQGVAELFIPDRIERARAVNFLVTLSISELHNAISDLSAYIYGTYSTEAHGADFFTRVLNIAEKLGVKPASNFLEKNEQGKEEYSKYFMGLIRCEEKLVNIRTDIRHILSSSYLVEQAITREEEQNFKVAIFDGISFLKPEQEYAFDKWNTVHRKSGINGGFLALSTVPDGVGGFTFFEDNLPSYNLVTLGNWREKANAESKHSQTLPTGVLGNIASFLGKGPGIPKGYIEIMKKRRKQEVEAQSQREQDFPGQESVEELKARTKELHRIRGGRRKTKRRRKRKHKRKTKRRKKTKRKRIKKRKTKRKK